MFRSCIAIASAGMGHAQLERRGRPVRLLKNLPALPLDCEKSMDCVDFTHLVSFFLSKRLNNIEAALFVSGPRKEFRKKAEEACVILNPSTMCSLFLQPRGVAFLAE